VHGHFEALASLIDKKIGVDDAINDVDMTSICKLGRTICTPREVGPNMTEKVASFIASISEKRTCLCYLVLG
jgi:hypothetical protein